MLKIILRNKIKYLTNKHFVESSVLNIKQPCEILCIKNTNLFPRFHTTIIHELSLIQYNNILNDLINNLKHVFLTQII